MVEENNDTRDDKTPPRLTHALYQLSLNTTKLYWEGVRGKLAPTPVYRSCPVIAASFSPQALAEPWNTPLPIPKHNELVIFHNSSAPIPVETYGPNGLTFAMDTPCHSNGDHRQTSLVFERTTRAGKLKFLHNKWGEGSGTNIQPLSLNLPRCMPAETPTQRRRWSVHLARAENPFLRYSPNRI